MKKALILLLVLLMLLPLAACQDAQDDPEDTTLAESNDPTETADPYDDKVPEMDLDEWEFLIAAPETWGNTYFDQEETTGDTVNDAIYTRNRALEDRFNIVIKSMNLGYTHEQATKFLPYKMSNEDVISMIGVAFTQSAKPVITEGIALPWNDTPYINLDQMWWNKSVTQTMAVLDNYYYLSGDINWASMPNVSAWYFNKSVAASNKIPDLYQTVRDGNWTWDVANGYIKQLTNDEGDGVWDEKDSYGHLQYKHSIEAWLYSTGYQTVYFTDDGPIMNYSTTRMQEVLNQVYDLLYTKKESYLSEDQALLTNIFFDNRALFMTNIIGQGANFRTYDTDFGILPNPKYNAEQKEYYTISDQWGLVLCMPSTTTDPSRTGAVVEAMAALSHKLIRPAYYDRTLLGKIKRDDESEEMLDIIFAGILYDPGQCYLSDLNLLPLRGTVLAGNANIMSWWRGKQRMIESNFNELYEAVQKQNNATPAE